MYAIGKRSMPLRIVHLLIWSLSTIQVEDCEEQTTTYVVPILLCHMTHIYFFFVLNYILHT